MPGERAHHLRVAFQVAGLLCSGGTAEDRSLTEDNLVRFVREHVRSVWALELVLALRRFPERRWAVNELVQELRASNMVVTTALRGLERSGLVIREKADGYRYAPAAPFLEELCTALETAYRERPVATINLISRPSDPIQSLADAFKFRGDPQ